MMMTFMLGGGGASQERERELRGETWEERRASVGVFPRVSGRLVKDSQCSGSRSTLCVWPCWLVLLAGLAGWPCWLASAAAMRSCMGSVLVYV